MRIRLAIFLFSLPLVASAAEANFDASFRAGLSDYQTKDYAKAATEFQTALTLDDRNTAAMDNLALAAFQLNKKGEAIAWFRRALSENSSDAAARAGLRYGFSQLGVKEIPHKLESFETLHEKLLVSLNLEELLALSAITLLVGGWWALQWAGRRKRALESEEATPTFPWQAVITLAVCVAASVLAGLKSEDLRQPRGTIVVEKIGAKTLPSENGVALFDLFEGFEVVINDRQKDWVQVTYPGGLSGWIPRAALILAEGPI